MRAHRIKAHVTPNQPLVVPLPANMPEGEVEVIVLCSGAATQPGTFSSLRDFDDWLRQQPPSGRSKAEMDRDLDEERASWE